MPDRLDADKKTELSLDFLVSCYFGQTKDLVKAAIDRAYVDMASHTMKGFTKKENNKKWECRYQASQIIENGIVNYKDNESFEIWHALVIGSMKKIYADKKKVLTEGQAQKWLNMSIKYLYALYNTIYISEQLPAGVIHFFECTSERDYYPPIDSYILKEVNLKDEFDSWSKLQKRVTPKAESKKGKGKSCYYDDMVTAFEAKQGFRDNHGFLWELENWESASENKSLEKGSYAEFYFNKKQKKKS